MQETAEQYVGLNGNKSLAERDKVAAILNERTRHIREILKELHPSSSVVAHPYYHADIDAALARISLVSDNCYLEIDKLRRAVSKTVKTEIFSGSVMKLSEMQANINAFCAGKTVRNISIQEASDIIVCMVVYVYGE